VDAARVGIPPEGTRAVPPTSARWLWRPAAAAAAGSGGSGRHRRQRPAAAAAAGSGGSGRQRPAAAAAAGSGGSGRSDGGGGGGGGGGGVSPRCRGTVGAAGCRRAAARLPSAWGRPGGALARPKRAPAAAGR